MLNATVHSELQLDHQIYSVTSTYRQTNYLCQIQHPKDIILQHSFIN